MLDDYFSLLDNLDDFNSEIVWRSFGRELEMIILDKTYDTVKFLSFLDVFLSGLPRLYDHILHTSSASIPAHELKILFTICVRVSDVKLPVSLVLSIAGLFTESYPDRISQILEKQITLGFKEDFELALQDISDQLDRFLRRSEKSKMDEGSFLTMEGFDFLMDAVWTLFCVIQSTPILSQSIMKHSEFVISLATGYSSIMRLSDLDDEGEMFTKFLIQKFISELFDRFLDSSEDLAVSSHILLSLLMELLNIYSDGTQILQNTTLIVDLQHTFNLKSLIERMKGNLDDSQIEFLEASLETIMHGTTSHVDIPRALGSMELFPGPAVDTPKVMDDEEFFKYVSRSSLISQVKDLFPDLGEGYVDILLNHFNDDPEHVILILCEDNVPHQFEKVDKKQGRLPFQGAANPELLKESLKEPTVIEELPTYHESMQDNQELLNARRNVYDGDEFDVFHNDVDTSQIIFGKKRFDEGVLADTSEIQQLKEKIINYSIYDDEYDDTLDDWQTPVVLGDTKVELGAMPRAGSSDFTDPTLPHREILLNYYIGDPSLYDRSSRNSDRRKTLRDITKLTDEQIEGWRVMFDRNPAKKRVMEEHLLNNVQRGKRSTEGVDTGNNSNKPSSRGRGRGRGRRGSYNHTKVN